MAQESASKHQGNATEARQGGGTYIAGSVYTAGGDFVTGDKYEIHQLNPKDARRRRDQLVLLEKVRRFWVVGVLEKSLHEAARIRLGLEARPDLVAHPWETVVELPDQSDAVPSVPQRIGDVFDGAGRSLVILGDPGSGKTVTLIELARDLLVRAEADRTQPIPVVLNLSTWSEKRLPLEEWAAAELNAKYQVPRRIGSQWLADFDLLLLLDGLDEVRRDHQAACVDEINRFAEEHGLNGIAVCSRIAEYAALERKLKMGGAVRLQPLQKDQVLRYVESLGESQVHLQKALAADPVLQELGRSPLMLSVMTLAFEGAAPAVAPAVDQKISPEERRAQIFDTHIQRMFARGVQARQYSQKRTLGFLSWLAGRMEAENQSIFMIENLQPSWLETRRQIWTYVLISRMLGGLLLLLGFALVGGGDILAVIGLLGVGAFGGLVSGIVTGLRFERGRRKQPGLPRRPGRWERLPVIGVGVGIPVGALVGLFGAFQLYIQLFEDSLAPKTPEIPLWGAVLMSVLGGALLAITLGGLTAFVFEIVFGRRLRWQTLREDIRTVDALRWSWPLARRGARRGALIALVLAPILALPIGLGLGEGPIEMVVYVPFACCILGFLAASAGGPLGLLLGGLQGVAVADKSVPNSGIWLTVNNSLRIGGLVFVLVGFLYSLLRIPDSLTAALENLAFAFIVALLAVMFYGVLDFVQHFILRAMLWAAGRAPFRLVDILDQADDLVFLRKVGGGYIFVHRLLQEHFARMVASSDRTDNGF